VRKGLFAKSPFKREINPFTRIVAQWGLTGTLIVDLPYPQ
jgi:tryptophan synthase alpha subunit